MQKETNHLPVWSKTILLRVVKRREFVDRHIHIKAISPVLFNRQNHEIAESLRRHATSQVSLHETQCDEAQLCLRSQLGQRESKSWQKYISFQ